ncbi:MAG TPA: hypothetical protein VHK28_07320, partial [Candidatus Limnocylindria bacterium]|nr:hypothetical protein [Candidatus Limnocylindria bacterium]
MATDRALPLPGRAMQPSAEPGGLPRDRRLALAAVAAASVFAVGLGYLVAGGRWEMALVAAAAVPAILLVIRYAFAGILIWLLVMPFIVRLGSEQPSLVFWGVHRLGLPALLVLVLLLHVLGLRNRSFRFHLVDAMLLLFLAAGVFNVLYLSPSPLRGMVTFYDKLAMPILLFWLIRALAPGRRELSHLLAIGAVTVVIQCVIGVMSWVAPSLLPEGWLGRAGERTVGTLGGPAPYTITLVLFSMLAIYWFATITDRRSLQRPLLVGIVL